MVGPAAILRIIILRIWRCLTVAVSVEPRGVRMMRFGLAVMVLVDLIVRAPYIWELQTDAGVLGEREVSHDDWVYCLHCRYRSYSAQVFLHFLQAISASLLMAEVKPEITALATFVLHSSLISSNQVMLQGGDKILARCLFFAALLPYRRNSLQQSKEMRILREKEGGHGDVEDASSSSLTQIAHFIAQLGFMISTFSIYLDSVEGRKDSMEWSYLEGSAVFTILHDEGLVTPAGAIIRQSPTLCYLLTVSSMWAEAYVPWLLLAAHPGDGIIRFLGCVLLMGLHVGLGVTISLAFFQAVCFLALLPFLPPKVFDDLSKLSALWLPCSSSSSSSSSSPSSSSVRWSSLLSPSFSSLFSFSWLDIVPRITAENERPCDDDDDDDDSDDLEEGKGENRENNRRRMGKTNKSANSSVIVRRRVAHSSSHYKHRQQQQQQQQQHLPQQQQQQQQQEKTSESLKNSSSTSHRRNDNEKRRGRRNMCCISTATASSSKSSSIGLETSREFLHLFLAILGISATFLSEQRWFQRYGTPIKMRGGFYPKVDRMISGWWRLPGTLRNGREIDIFRSLGEVGPVHRRASLMAANETMNRKEHSAIVQRPLPPSRHFRAISTSWTGLTPEMQGINVRYLQYVCDTWNKGRRKIRSRSSKNTLFSLDGIFHYNQDGSNDNSHTTTTRTKRLPTDLMSVSLAAVVTIGYPDPDGEGKGYLGGGWTTLLRDYKVEIVRYQCLSAAGRPVGEVDVPSPVRGPLLKAMVKASDERERIVAEIRKQAR